MPNYYKAQTNTTTTWNPNISEYIVDQAHTQKDTEHTNGPIIVKSVVHAVVGPGLWMETNQ